ncbi:hypothetical protein BASA81_006577 [Batrachochytrium salamandrivorans]|nr:hypothetical protein BASA81_006577 [Batrachochytrium salamandrivorans]
MKLTFSHQEHVEELEFEDSVSVDEVESILGAVFPGLPRSGLAWVCDGKLVSTTNKSLPLMQTGLGNHALVVLTRTNNQQQPRAASLSTMKKKQKTAVHFPGMGFEDVLRYNPNPRFAVQVLRSHPELIREMGFHNPQLAQRIQTASSDKEAGEILGEIIVASEFARTMSKFEEEAMEADMAQKLKTNPADAAAKQYFDKKTNDQLLRQQSDLVMQEYPETLFPVLMLYIDTEINQTHVKAFVDSGAQTSVMTLECAKRCGISHLIDSRFAGKIVGVGQSTSLGKIMICPIKIGTTYFQMSVTVMDQLGDKNMEFLFGLDMLKRHRFVIDLEQGALRYHGANGLSSTPFLHEKDLSVSRGGTQGLQIDANGMPVDRGQGEEEEEQDAEFQAKVSLLVSRGHNRELASVALREQNGDVDSAEVCLMFGQQQQQ